LSRIPYWQLIAMPSALITWGLFIFAHRTRRRWTVWQKSDPSALPDPRHISWLHWAVVIRSLCTIVSLLLAFGYVALALGLPQLGADINHLPGGLAFLKTIYGPYLP
jgi:small-conductance mechanosensitive channel